MISSASADANAASVCVLMATRRRRLAMAMHLVASGQGPQGSKRADKEPFCWADHVARLSELEFKQRYRLTFDAFYEMLDSIKPALTVDEKMAKVTKNGHVVEPEVKLAIALRFLAGGSPLDLCLIYHVSKSHVYDCVWCVVDAINERYDIKFPIDDPERLQELEIHWRAQASCPGWTSVVVELLWSS